MCPLQGTTSLSPPVARARQRQRLPVSPLQHRLASGTVQQSQRACCPSPSAQPGPPKGPGDARPKAISDPHSVPQGHPLPSPALAFSGLGPLSKRKGGKTIALTSSVSSRINLTHLEGTERPLAQRKARSSRPRCARARPPSVRASERAPTGC